MSTTPVPCAFFAATDDDLAAAFPGWQRERTLDIDASVAIPLAPPTPSGFAPLPDRWWVHLLDYYLLLCPEDDDAREALYDEGLNHDERNELVFPQVLFAGPTAPLVCRPRDAFLDASAALDDAACEAIGKELLQLHFPERFVATGGRGEVEDLGPAMDAYGQQAVRSLRALRSFFASRTKPIWLWGWNE